MKTSESIKEIAAALCAAQKQMTGATKGSDNPFFKSKYSDLTAVMEAIAKPFADNGLSFVQSPSIKHSSISVTTRIMHKSGEWIQGTVYLPPTKQDIHGHTSAITYGKRYGLQAMTGCPSVDDDGVTASKQPPDKSTAKQKRAINSLLKTKVVNVPLFYNAYNVASVSEMSFTQAEDAVAKLSKKRNKT